MYFYLQNESEFYIVAGYRKTAMSGFVKLLDKKVYVKITCLLSDEGFRVRMVFFIYQ